MDWFLPMSTASPKRTHKKLLLAVNAALALADFKDGEWDEQSFCRSTNRICHWADKLSIEDPELYAGEKEFVHSSLSKLASVLYGWCRGLMNHAAVTNSRSKKAHELGRALYYTNHYVIPWYTAAFDNKSVAGAINFAMNELVLTYFPLGWRGPDTPDADFYKDQFDELADFASGWGVSFNEEKLEQLYDSYS